MQNTKRSLCGAVPAMSWRKQKQREHILAGLMIAVQNIDEVIRLIRISKNANEARKRLMEAFDITSVQAQAILDLRLRRLTGSENWAN